MVHDPSVVLLSDCAAWTEVRRVQPVTLLRGQNLAGRGLPGRCPHGGLSVVLSRLTGLALVSRAWLFPRSCVLRVTLLFPFSSTSFVSAS